MALPDDVVVEIEGLVRAGFDTRGRIVAVVCEELYAPGELERTDVEVAVEAASRLLALEARAWPPVTDCDRLDAAFARLDAGGIVSLQNAGYTQSDGFDEVREAARARPDRDALVGYCFYHGQDLARAVAGGGLYLAFGPRNPRREQEDGPAIGALIVAELAAAGLHAVWDGRFDTRIHLPAMDWKRRMPAG